MHTRRQPTACDHLLNVFALVGAMLQRLKAISCKAAQPDTTQAKNLTWRPQGRVSQTSFKFFAQQITPLMLMRASSLVASMRQDTSMGVYHAHTYTNKQWACKFYIISAFLGIGARYMLEGYLAQACDVLIGSPKSDRTGSRGTHKPNKPTNQILNRHPIAPSP